MRKDIVILAAVATLAAACSTASPSDGEGATPTTSTARSPTPQSTLRPAEMPATQAPATTVVPPPADTAPMMRGHSGHTVDALFTVGDSVDGYLPIGRLDGIGAFELDPTTVRLLVNHEVDAVDGYAYGLGNDTQLTGARISYFDIDKATRQIMEAGLAYDTVYDRSGSIVTGAAQINEFGHSTAGFSRFCSAQYVAPGDGFGFIDQIFFTNEEVGTSRHPHGGSVWALDVERGVLWGLPELGRGVWENVTPLDTGDPSTIALLLSEDTIPAPMYLWVGRLHPEAGGTGDFVYRNGLADGTLHVWVPDDAAAGPLGGGSFRPIAVQSIGDAGSRGHDTAGYKDSDTLTSEAIVGLGAHGFARPEDVATDPGDTTVVAYATTGAYPDADDWGAVYRVDLDFTTSSIPTAVVTVLHDANDFRDEGIRNPDNLDWADNGHIYVQEDKTHDEFGAVSGRDASILELDPDTGEFAVIAEMVRSAELPHFLGQWESSGVLDVTGLFGLSDDEILLVATVQAHGLATRQIVREQLVSGGQLIWIRRTEAR